jgi:hypothetical protein
MVMIGESEMLDLIGNNLPEINSEFEKLSSIGNAYKTVQCFADYTKQLVTIGNFKEVKYCFSLAEKLLQEGNSTVKNAIENVYLHSLAPLLDLGDVLGKSLRLMLKGSLRKEYSRQVCSSGL